MFGAIGDGIVDDTLAIRKMLDTVTYGTVCMFNKKYKITSPIKIVLKSQFKIAGYGIIEAECDDAIMLDGCGWCTISDLHIRAKKNAIHLISTNGGIQYVKLNNIYAECSSTIGDNIGCFIERTTRYCNEVTVTGCYFANFQTGIKVYNPAVDVECAGHKFIDCSTENSKFLGQHLVNANYITFSMCRHVESHSKDWKTEGVCNQLVIIGGYIWDDKLGHGVVLSDKTNGVIIGRYRSGTYYVENPVGIAMIVEGCIIPNEKTMLSEIKNLIGVTNIPDSTGVLYTSFKDYAGEPETTEFDTKYYGGSCKINRISLVLGGNCTRSVKIGTFQKTFENNAMEDKLVILDFILGHGWIVSYSELSKNTQNILYNH